MSEIEILSEFRQLPFGKQIEVLAAAAQIIQERFRQASPRPNRQLSEGQMSYAAQALLDDYTTDRELTIFTSIDQDEFYAEE